MIISEKILEFLLLGLEKQPQKTIEDISEALERSFLEIEKSILRPENESEFSKYVFQVKPICNLFNYPSLWVVVQEISLFLNLELSIRDNELRKNKIMNFLSNEELISNLLKIHEIEVSNEHSKNLWTFLKLIFGDPEKNRIVFNFGIKRFFKEEYFDFENFKLDAENIAFLEESRRNKTPKEKRPNSEISFTDLPPIFDCLMKDPIVWTKEVVDKLEKFYFLLNPLDSDGKKWKITWPIWYDQKNLPSFNEILIKLIQFNSYGYLEHIDKHQNKYDEIEKKSPFIYPFLYIRNLFYEKGFVECHTSKFDDLEINELADIALKDKPKITLRDDIVHSLLNKVLLKNLNHNLYPIFEIAYCPWRECWQIALLSTSLIKEGKKRHISRGGIFFYNWKDLKDLIEKELFEFFWSVKKIIDYPIATIQELEPQKWEKVEYSGATEFAHILDKNGEKIGFARVHRLEEFEKRHMEVISVCIDLKSFY